MGHAFPPPYTVNPGGHALRQSPLKNIALLVPVFTSGSRPGIGGGSGCSSGSKGWDRPNFSRARSNTLSVDSIKVVNVVGRKVVSLSPDLIKFVKFVVRKFVSLVLVFPVPSLLPLVSSCRVSTRLEPLTVSLGRSESGLSITLSLLLYILFILTLSILVLGGPPPTVVFSPLLCGQGLCTCPLRIPYELTTNYEFNEFVIQACPTEARSLPRPPGVPDVAVDYNREYEEQSQGYEDPR